MLLLSFIIIVGSSSSSGDLSKEIKISTPRPISRESSPGLTGVRRSLRRRSWW